MTNFRRFPIMIWDAILQAVYGTPGLDRKDSKLFPGRNVFKHCPYCGKWIGSRSSSQVYRCQFCDRVFLVKAFYVSRK